MAVADSSARFMAVQFDDFVLLISHGQSVSVGQVHHPSQCSTLSEAVQAIQIVPYFDPVEHVPGTVIFREGDVADALYIIRHGEVDSLVMKAIVLQLRKCKCR